MGSLAMISMFIIVQVAYSCIPALQPSSTSTEVPSEPPTEEATKAPTTAKKDTTKKPDVKDCLTVDLNPGRTCVFPFTYQYHQHYECLPFKDKFWCALTPIYDKKEWGYCDQTLCPPTAVQPTEEPAVTPGPGSTTTATTTTNTTTTTTTAEVEKGHTNLTLRDGDQGVFCDVEFDYTMNKTFKLDTDLLFKCNPTSDLQSSKAFLEQKQFKLKTSQGVDLDCSMNAIFSNDESGSIEVPEKAVEKSLSCNVSTELCLTNNGSVYPAKCAPTFRYLGREYHACTDKEMEENDDRLWCATLVDADNNVVPGHWGYCSSKCSYCAGSPITKRLQTQPCGYDCLVNPEKPMKGSVGSKDIPLLSPLANMYGEQEANFLEEVRGQFRLNIGNQLVRLTCPISSFFDSSLKQMQTVYVKCGPTQYRFTVYSDSGDLLHEEFANDRFGCDPCPNTYKYVPGYLSSTREKTHIGTSENVPDVDNCEDLCYGTRTCQSFSHSKKDKICKLFSNIILEPTFSFNIRDYTTCTMDTVGRTTLRKTTLDGEIRKLQSEMDAGNYVRERTEYQTGAYRMLEWSIADKTIYAYQKGNLFTRNMLQTYVMDSIKVGISTFCGGVGTEKVYELPSTNRLRLVVYEMAYLMLQYGGQKKRKYIKVDNFLFEVLLARDDSLYDNPVGCYYSKESPTPGGMLSKQECDDIILNYNAEKTNGENGIQYNKFRALLSWNNHIIMDSLSKMFFSERKHGPAEVKIHFEKYYKGKTNAEQFKAFLSEKLSMAIFVETVRNIEMLPVLLALLDLGPANWNILGQSGYIGGGTFFLDLHPMTQSNSFCNKNIQYERRTGSTRLEGVGFFPVWTQVRDERASDFWYSDWDTNILLDYPNFPKNPNENTLKNIIAGTLKVHERAEQIYRLFRSIKVTGTASATDVLVNKFFVFQPVTDELTKNNIRKLDKIKGVFGSK